MPLAAQHHALGPQSLSITCRVRCRQAYQFYNPDLPYFASEADAKAHYLRAGYIEGRIYRRVPTTLRYKVLGGLCNQLYSHLSVLALAATMGAEVIVPPALARESFQQNGGWLEAPPDALLDLGSMAQHWRAQGVSIHKVCCGLFVMTGSLCLNLRLQIVLFMDSASVGVHQGARAGRGLLPHLGADLNHKWPAQASQDTS